MKREGKRINDVGLDGQAPVSFMPLFSSRNWVLQNETGTANDSTAISFLSFVPAK
jgi:hypothetical protein